jgi:hypothetical protein
MPDSREPPRPPEPPRRGAAGRRLSPDQYEIKIRWERARQVFNVSPQGVGFKFDTPLKVGARYPISLSAPGVSFSSTLEVTRCKLTVETDGRFFRIDGRFYPYVE